MSHLYTPPPSAAANYFAAVLERASALAFNRPALCTMVN